MTDTITSQNKTHIKSSQTQKLIILVLFVCILVKLKIIYSNIICFYFSQTQKLFILVLFVCILVKHKNYLF
jgi:hypothetical protein